VWDFVEGNMQTYLLLKEKVKAFQKDSDIEGILNAMRARQKPLPPLEEIAATQYDAEKLMATRLPYEKLDQLVVELLLGAR
jgi:xylose isomerase